MVASADQVQVEQGRRLRHGIVLPNPELTLRTVANGALHPAWAWHFLTSPALGFSDLSTSGLTSRQRLAEMFDGSVGWPDLDWIRQEWDGPIALKGVLSADDARRAAGEGVDAVIVSNDGGRQQDHVPAALEVLPGIADAVGDRVEVLFDSGIRRGSDIVTALALGARAVLVGRARPVRARRGRGTRREARHRHPRGRSCGPRWRCAASATLARPRPVPHPRGRAGVAGGAAAITGIPPGGPDS